MPAEANLGDPYSFGLDPCDYGRRVHAPCFEGRSGEANNRQGRLDPNRRRLPCQRGLPGDQLFAGMSKMKSDWSEVSLETGSGGRSSMHGGFESWASVATAIW